MARTTTTTKPATPNKAQAEFDKYTKRRRGAGGGIDQTVAQVAPGGCGGRP